MPKSVKGVMHEWKTGTLHSGSSKGPVVTAQKQAVAIALSEQRQLHPALQARAVAVKAAHAHLSKTQPGFRQLKPHEQFAATQRHISKKPA